MRRFEAAITPKTRLILVSHVINLTGQVMPVREVVLRSGATAVIPVFPQWGLFLLWGGTFVFGPPAQARP